MPQTLATVLAADLVLLDAKSYNHPTVRTKPHFGTASHALGAMKKESSSATAREASHPGFSTSFPTVIQRLEMGVALRLIVKFLQGVRSFFSFAFHGICPILAALLDRVRSTL